MSANEGVLCLLIYETRDGFHAYQCSVEAFDRLTNTLREELLQTWEAAIFVKYPTWLAPDQAKQIALDWRQAQKNRLV